MIHYKLQRACFRLLTASAILLSSLSIKAQDTNKQTVVWKLTDPALVGGFRTEVLGKPYLLPGNDQIPVTRFNGVNDGIIIPVNPIKGMSKFTIEALFRPEDGISAPRFIHFTDTSNNRGTLEVRVTKDNTWYLDTFLANGKTGDHLTLIDSTKQYPCNSWYWVALVYDGEKMSSYVNAVEQGTGPVKFVSNEPGKISVGVRQNKVNWFKGGIGEIRFHTAPLTITELQHL